MLVLAFACVVVLELFACTRGDPPAPPVRAKTRAAGSTRAPHEVVIDAPRAIETTTGEHVELSRGTDLYLPPWFRPRDGAYDLLVHFHGLPKLQEANVGEVRLNAAVVSANLGVGTDAYGSGYRDPESFTRLLAEVQEHLSRDPRTERAKLGRLALSAWSAGFVSVSKILADDAARDRVDAILLADGFFTTYTAPRKRTMNVGPLERFVAFAAAAERSDKLFAITHTAIPSSDYPSVTDVVAKLLELTKNRATPSSRAGPGELRETYAVDRGGFHVRGFEGKRAADHVKQIQVMGATLYPYLKARWDIPISNPEGGGPAR